jgi:hypothetical protein
MLKVQSIPPLAVALLALVGCQGAGGLGGQAASAPPAQPVAQVSYAGNGAIEVVSTDPRPIARVEVIGPAGPIQATVSVHRETIDPNPYGSQMAQGPVMSPYVGLGVGSSRWSRSHHVGSGVYFGMPPYGFGRPYPYGGYAAAPPPDGGPMRSTARVTFDDPAAYERQWRNATVRVRFGDGQDATVDLPAPAPSR